MRCLHLDPLLLHLRKIIIVIGFLPPHSTLLPTHPPLSPSSIPPSSYPSSILLPSVSPSYPPSLPPTLPPSLTCRCSASRRPLSICVRFLFCVLSCSTVVRNCSISFSRVPAGRSSSTCVCMWCVHVVCACGVCVCVYACACVVCVCV